MKTKIVLFCIVMLAISTYCISQTNQSSENKTISVTVNGQGKTKDEAKQIALRNAIEQAFGTFISSNTQLLNDELIKDEIVSVTNGNIEKYEIISEIQLADGTIENTVTAIVSLNKLTSFCESKGIEIEFKGGLFAVNLKQQKFNEENEIKVIKNTVIVLNKLFVKGFDFNLKVSEPVLLYGKYYEVKLEVEAKANSNLTAAYEYLYNTLKGISLTKTEADGFTKTQTPVYNIFIPSKNEYFYLRSGVSTQILFTNMMLSLANGMINFGINDGSNVFYCTAKFIGDRNDPVYGEVNSPNYRGGVRMKCGYKDIKFQALDCPGSTTISGSSLSTPMNYFQRSPENGRNYATTITDGSFPMYNCTINIPRFFNSIVDKATGQIVYTSDDLAKVSKFSISRKSEFE